MAEAQPDIQRRVQVLELTCRYLLFAMRGSPELPAVEDMRRIVDAGEVQAPPAQRRRTEQQPPRRVVIAGLPAINDKQYAMTVESTWFNAPTEGADSIVVDVEEKYALTPVALDAQYLMMYVLFNGSQPNLGGLAQFLDDQRLSRPSQRLIIVLCVTPGSIQNAFPRPRAITDITNIPILFCRLAGNYREVASTRTLNRDNAGTMMNGRGATDFHEMYEVLQIHSGALRRPG